MGIAARVVADSISPSGKRITTFVLTYPRFVHAEFMTHRNFSRNAASSRAIPSRKIRQSVRLDPAQPVFWGANQSGMQADAELKGWRLFLVKAGWSLAAYLMLGMSWFLEKLGLHKQLANRILEPWFNITVVCTATDWGNFYNLRNHRMAQPEIKALAEAMLDAHNQSKPRLLGLGHWHLPFIEDSDWMGRSIATVRKISVARCARVSYMNHEGKRSTVEEDLALYDRLVGGEPKHASPAEHQAMPAGSRTATSGNFQGWVQFRKLLDRENLPHYPGLHLQ